VPFAHFTASLQSPGSQEAKPGEWVRAKRRAQLPLPGNGASSLLASFEPCAGLGGQIVAAHRWPASSLSAQPAEPSRSSLLGDSGQHSWPDFVLIVKGELVIGASGMDARTARATLSLRPLTGALQGPEDSPGSSGWPVAHLESRTKRLMPPKEALEMNRTGVKFATPVRAARLATGQAMILADAGRTSDAHAVLLRNAAQNRSSGLRSNLAHSLLSLASLELRMGVRGQVRERVAESLTLDNGPHNQTIAVEILVRSGSIDRAKAILGAFENRPLRLHKMATARMESEIASAEGRHAEALAYAREAAREDQEAGGKSYLARTLLEMGFRREALTEFVAVHRQKVHQFRRAFPEPAGYWRDAMENALRIAESEGDALRTQVRKYLTESAI